MLGGDRCYKDYRESLQSSSVTHYAPGDGIMTDEGKERFVCTVECVCCPDEGQNTEQGRREYLRVEGGQERARGLFPV